MFVCDVAETVRNVSSAGLALLVTKGINQFPEPDQKLKGTIDVWWIVHILFSVLLYHFFSFGCGRGRKLYAISLVEYRLYF